MNKKKEVFKSGFISIIGRPNVGKSTFINQVLGKKISIISPKPQTTRNNIRGVYTTEHSQMIFVDTPGIHKPHHELGAFMNKESLYTIKDSDMILYLIDALEDFGTGDEFVINELKKARCIVYLVVNKMDLVKDKNRLIQNVDKFIKAYEFKNVFYISALTGENIDLLLKDMEDNLDEGPMYYPSDTVSDHPIEFVIGEIIREKVLLLTNEEVPHSVAVVVDFITPSKENSDMLDINATIYVERQSQKKIIIGSNGSMIKKIGTLARKEIKLLINQKIYLELWVKVEEDWRNKKSHLKRLGYTLDNIN